MILLSGIPPIEDPAVEDSVMKDSPRGDTSAQDPPVEDPPMEDPPIEDPPVEDSAVEDPAMDLLRGSFSGCFTHSGRAPREARGIELAIWHSANLVVPSHHH